MPELSLFALTGINALLLCMYLPMGFMGWAFAAGGLANSPNAEANRGKQRWILIAACTPAILILVTLIAPHFLPEPWAHGVAWSPLGALAILIGLILLGAAISGFVSGVRGEPDSD